MARIRALRAGPDPQLNSPRAADGQQAHNTKGKENISAAPGSVWKTGEEAWVKNFDP
jgi:hypothetical protein